MPTASLPQDPDLEQLRKPARELQRTERKGLPEALHAAAEKGDTGLIRRLLDRGADPNVLDHRFRATPLDWARYFNHHDAVALLEPVTRARQ